MIAMPDHIDGELAWGYWLRLEDRGGRPVLIDADGAAWPTVREAFMDGRLRMPRSRGHRHETAFEQLLSVLISVAKSRSTRDSAFLDLFSGNTGYGAFFMTWLAAEGLIHGEGSEPRWMLTAEGAAAMRMLFATRPHAIGGIRPGRASLDELIRLGIGPDLGEPDRVRVEAAARVWPGAFLRQDVGGRPTIIAVTRPNDTGGVAVGRTVWNVAFKDAEKRDMLYDWLCERLDRWEDWLELALVGGGEQLTLALLSLTVQDDRLKLAKRSAQ